MTAQEQLARPFEHSVDSLINPFINGLTVFPSIEFGAHTFVTEMNNRRSTVFGETGSTNGTAQTLVDSFPDKRSLLRNVIGFVSAVKTGEINIDKNALRLLGLEKDENIRYLLDLAAGINRLRLATDLDRVQRDVSFADSLSPASKSTLLLMDEIDELQIFQSRLRARASPTPLEMRK